MTALYLRTPQAAKLLGVSPKTLYDWRCLHQGPPFRQSRSGVPCLYDREKLGRWAWQNRGRRATKASPQPQ